MSEEEDSLWRTDLETALLEGSDYGSIRNICKGRPVPNHLRAEVWKVCFGLTDKPSPITQFNDMFDLAEQATIRNDCEKLVDRLGNDESDKVSVVSDLESILTFYCKSKEVQYSESSGWLELLQPMLALKLSRSDLYNYFYSTLAKFVPKECRKGGRPFHLFRLLLLYHEPELCNFLDTKRVTVDSFALIWFRSLFGAICDLRVTLNMWDVYFLHGDPFLMFFLALVILVNAKDAVLAMSEASKEDIISALSNMPSELEADDITDFCELAQHYASHTPQSFRRDFQLPLFGTSLSTPEGGVAAAVAQALCLPVSVHELLQANGPVQSESVRYFVVDCRPAEQYNSGHLPTAFHLDANLMLQNVAEFKTAVQALFAVQRQALASESVGSGEHLCFVGSGRDEEDQYVHMVVAHFLQTKSPYVSLARGGYAAIHKALQDNLSRGLADHCPASCLVCTPELAGHDTSDTEHSEGAAGSHPPRQPSKPQQGDGFFGKFTKKLKERSQEMTEKVVSYIKNDDPLPERHVSSTDRVGKRYRNVANVFSIGDDDDDDDPSMLSSDEDQKEMVSIEVWLKKPDVRHSFKCQHLKDNGYMLPSFLLVTENHLFLLREVPDRKGMAWIHARHALSSVIKITSKKRHPELITFKYGSSSDSGLLVEQVERFVIPQAQVATRAIKQQIMRVLQDMTD